MEINENTTIFLEKEKDSNIYNVEVANDSSQKKIANIKLEKITDIRFHVRKEKRMEEKEKVKIVVGADIDEAIGKLNEVKKLLEEIKGLAQEVKDLFVK